MQITLTPFRAGNKGYALIITMVFLAVMLLIFGSMMMWTSTNAKINQRNNQFNMSEAAAEAATERVLAPMERDFLSQSLTNASYYASLASPSLLGQTNYDGTPWPVRYVFSDANGLTNQISVIPGQVQSSLLPVGSEYSNLLGFNWYWTNIAIATPIGQPYTVSATVTQVVNFSSIPIFQYAIFYDINLEIAPGQPMTINGPVFSDAGIWAGSQLTTFSSTVGAVNQVNVTDTDPFDPGYKPQNGGPTFTLAGQPTSGNTAVTMPVAGATNSDPTNVETILNIPPLAYAMGTAPAYTTNGLEYLANGADLIISNSNLGTNFGSLTPYGTNITISFQSGVSPNYLQQITPDFYIFKGPPFPPTGRYTNFVSLSLSDTNRCYTNVYYAGWSFVTNVAFYDYRESDTVQAVQIDVSKFNIWVTNTATNGGNFYNSLCIFDKGNHKIDSIWVYNSVPSTSTTLPAVRVVNGQQLPSPSGFTVVTPMPIYVQGDYNKQIATNFVSSGTNTANTYPAALMGDAVTILSSNWSDSYSLSNTTVNATTLAARPAANTTINAAALEGIVQSTNSNYSGGVENFLRLLEDWNPGSGTRSTLTYNGSIVVMFPSIYATGYWNGNYYSIPTRNWGFDYNFTQQSKLPPLTPQIKKTVRVSWNAQ
jgi:hypothetical protein